MRALSSIPLVLGLFLALPASAEDLTEEFPSQILVDLVDDTTDADLAAVAHRLDDLPLRLNSVHSAKERFFIAEVDPAKLDDYVARLTGDPRVENVEPVYYYEALMMPNDPMFEQQWSMKMVGAPAAWDGATGKGVTVAVIDTGVAYVDHKGFKKVEDLADTKFAQGYDFVGDTDVGYDDHSHGTHVAGTIAQSTNNGVGVSGLAYEATIMPLKVLSSRGFGSTADIADAIRYAADEGAQVINMSLGGPVRSLVLESAVKYARKKGVIVVCAAGNERRGQVSYPAAYPGAFAVSSVGPDSKRAFYSNWGQQIAIAAPGGSSEVAGPAGGKILQNTINPARPGQTDFYAAYQGTSMAAPHVAAAAALVISAGVTDPDQVEKILRQSARDAGPKGWDPEYGDGILDASAAVAAAQEATHGPAYLLAGLGWLGLFLLRTKKRLSFGPTMLAGVVLGSSGLFFLDRLGVSGLIAEPIANWDRVVFGAAGFRTALWASVLPMFGLASFFLGMRKSTRFLLGLSLGWAAHLFVAAVLMPADVQLIPGLAGVLDRIWLVANGGLLSLLAVLIGRVRQ